MMEFSGDFTVDGTPEELWKYFTDPDILMDCAPGCNKMVLESPSEIVAGLTVGVGSVKPSFDVEGIVTACDRPNRLEIEATGEASRNSFEVTAWQELQDNGDGTTTVTWQANAEISGIIASLGERAIGSVADKLVNEFFQDLEDHVNAGTPAESKLSAATDEELETAQQLASDSTETGGDLSGKAIGKAMEVANGEGPGSGGSFAAGVVLGLLGSSVLRRLRSGGRQQAEAGRSGESAPSPEHSPSEGQSSSAGGGTPSLLVLGLTAALGAAGAIIWSQSQSESDGESSDRTDEATTETVQEPPSIESTGESEPALNSTGKGDSPLDRLESRP